MKKELMASFQAIGSDGKTYKIKAFRFSLDPGDILDVDPSTTDPAKWRYFAKRGNGKYVRIERIAKGKYKILDEAFHFASNDPNAP